MRAFTTLYARLDETTATREKITAMCDYFGSARAADAAWAVYFLTGRRIKRLIRTTDLRQWTVAITGLPAWLVEETYAAVGDLAETIALLLDYAPAAETRAEALPLHRWVEERVLPLRRVDDETRRRRVTRWWLELPADGRFVLNKLLTGSFRVGVSRRLVVRVLAQHSGVDSARIAHRLTGAWEPTATFFERLLDPRDRGEDVSQPYPFFLASPLVAAHDSLGEREQWLAEWKWDGIRAQLIRRQGQCFVWSRGEELMSGRFPELDSAAARLPDGTVLDGEILAWQNDGPLPFARLQRRIGRLRPSERMQRDHPVIFQAYDLLEFSGDDWRGRALGQRRETLARLLTGVSPSLRISPAVEARDWAALAALRSQARGRGTEGLMLKHLASAYRVGRVLGDWWKWKVDPLSLDAVLLYAQPGHGRRSSLFTDYTFGVWREDQLIPVAKAYSGLQDKEIERLDRWIRQHTVERFGPVRAVEHGQVFELAFEGIQASTRHKSGVALRFPRISRWRCDIGVDDAETLEQVQEMLRIYGT